MLIICLLFAYYLKSTRVQYIRARCCLDHISRLCQKMWNLDVQKSGGPGPPRRPRPAAIFSNCGWPAGWPITYLASPSILGVYYWYWYIIGYNLMYFVYNPIIPHYLLIIAFLFFQGKHVPGIWGRVLVILNSKLMNILITYCIFGFKNQFWRQPAVALYFCFQEKHVPGIVGRVLVILSSTIMKNMILYCIFGFKNQFWRQPGWRYFFVFRKNTSLEFRDVFWWFWVQKWWKFWLIIVFLAQK